MRGIRCRYLIAALIMVLNSPALALGQGSGVIPKELIEAARAEGRLVIYSGMGLAITQAYVRLFEEAFPFIRTEIVRQTSHQIHQRFLTEQRARRYLADVVVHVNAGAYFADLVRGGHIMKYPIPTDSDYPDQLKVKDYAYPLFVYLSGPVYNTMLTSKEDVASLQTWEGIADPRWSGRAVVSVPTAGGSSYAPNYMFLVRERSRFGPSFLQKVAANRPLFFTSTIPAHQAVVSGEKAVFLWGNSPNAGDLLERGAPIAMTFPSPTPAIPAVAGIAATAPHPNAAKLFMRWAFSEAGQRAALQAFNSPVVYRPLKDEAPPAFAKMAGGWKGPTELLAIDWDEWDARFQDVVTEWNAIFGYRE